VLQAFATGLDPEAAERAARFRRELDRRAFLGGRALAAMLAASFGMKPQLRLRDGGKPALCEADGPDLSISHSGGWVAVAMGGGQAVGVDLEPVDRPVDGLALAERFFTADEYAALRLLPPAAQQERFLAAWTVKEAWAKATGLGLSADLGKVQLAAPGVIALHEDDVDWTVALYRPEPVLHLALALHHPESAPPTIEWGRACWGEGGFRIAHASISPVASNRSATCG